MYPQSGEGPALLTVIADYNRSQKLQRGSIEIRGANNHSLHQNQIYVEQEGWSASVNPEYLLLPHEKGAVEKLYIITSGWWEIWTIPLYVSLSQTRGYGSSCVEVITTTENTSSKDLSDVIFIDGDNLSEIVTFIQKHNVV